MHDTVIIDMHKYLAPLCKEGIKTVYWIRQVLDLNIPLDDIIRHMREKEKIFQFHAEISTNLKDMEFFYKQIFTPYILKRYKKDAIITDFDEVKEIRLKKNTWELLLIKKKDVCVGGACCLLTEDIYYWYINGLIDDIYLKEGAMAAIYYFPILRAKERNAKFVDFGLSRPFLTDGVLSYKRKWGTKICMDTNKRIVYLKNLIKEDLIIIEDNQLKAIIFSGKNANVKPYSNSGLELKIVEPIPIPAPLKKG